MQFELTLDEALVLFDWLSRFNDSNATFDDQAEQRVLWDLEAMLETQLDAVVADDYRDRLAGARQRVRDEPG